MFDVHVVLSNTPGALAAMATLLGQNGIGLEGGGAFAVGHECHAHFLVEDGARAREVLESVGMRVQNVVRPVIRKLPQLRPGELGEITAMLGHYGVNILSQYSDHANRLILVTDNDVLASQVTQRWGVAAE